MIHTILLTILLAFSPSLWATPQLEALKQLFAKRFDHNYVQNQCGQNIVGLVEEAQARGIDMGSAHIIRITNVGGTDIDQVPAMRAREKGPIIEEVYNQYFTRGPLGHRMTKPIPPGVRIRQEGADRWVFYHAILEFEGHIFDLDFTNSPTVLPTAEYLRQMFIPRDEAFYLKNRGEFGWGFSGDSFETFVARVQDELILSSAPATEARPEWKKQTLRQFRCQVGPCE